MQTALNLNGSLPCFDGQFAVELRTPVVDMSHIQARLDGLSAELRTLWFSALERGHFQEINRLVEASHAVHRAFIALESDTPIPGALTSR